MFDFGAEIAKFGSAVCCLLKAFHVRHLVEVRSVFYRFVSLDMIFLVH